MHLVDQYVREILVWLAFARSVDPRRTNQSMDGWMDGWISSIESLNAAAATATKKLRHFDAENELPCAEYIFHNALLMLAGGAV